jgi:hypothetical protein
VEILNKGKIGRQMIIPSRKLLLIVYFFFTAVVIVVITSACSSKNDVDSDSAEFHMIVNTRYEVAPVFRAFYEYHGGVELLGSAISPVMIKDGKEYQYFENACIKFDANASEASRFQFNRIAFGFDLENLWSKGRLEREESDSSVPIFGEFIPLYKELGGEKIVGKPLTYVRFNPSRKRYEQYFENLGLYRLVEEKTENIHLLAYGDWSCREECQHNVNGESEIDVYPYIADPFINFVAEFGLDFTGFPLTKAYLAPDGNIEQVFEKCVLAVNIDGGDNVFLRKLPVKLGVTDFATYYSFDDKNISLSKSEFVIPEFFTTYIESHGGVEVIGEPISHYTYQDQRVYRQCFENMCLNYSEDLYEKPYVQGELLGYAYREIYFRSQQESSYSNTRTDISLHTWVTSPSIRSDEEQEIWVGVLKNGVPFTGGELKLTIFIPDDKKIEFSMKPAQKNGQTFAVIPPLNLRSGTLIPYQVCLQSVDRNNICVEDDYLIWNLP